MQHAPKMLEAKNEDMSRMPGHIRIQVQECVLEYTPYLNPPPGFQPEALFSSWFTSEAFRNTLPWDVSKGKTKAV